MTEDLTEKAFVEALNKLWDNYKLVPTHRILHPGLIRTYMEDGELKQEFIPQEEVIK